MSCRPASRQLRAGRGIPRSRRTLTTLSGLAIFMTAAIGLAPAASATHVPPGAPAAPPSPPLPPPPTTQAAYFPLWAIIAIVLATVVPSAGTTLVTLSLVYLRRGRQVPASVAESQVSMPNSATTPEPAATQGDVLSSHHYAAGQDMHQADSRERLTSHTAAAGIAILTAAACGQPSTTRCTISAPTHSRAPHPGPGCGPGRGSPRRVPVRTEGPAQDVVGSCRTAAPAGR
jgi:hypothetical protein